MNFNWTSGGTAKQDMVVFLNEILKHERKHFGFYLQASMMVRGRDRIYLKPIFEKEMLSELEHVKMFGDKIIALGGTPTLESHTFDDEFTNGEDILIYAVEMEREVLEVYHKLYPLAEVFAATYADKSIVLLLEENIEHTTADVEEFEKMLYNW